MVCKGGGLYPALRVVFGLSIWLPVASQASAADTYTCTFTKECIGAKPCDPDISHNVDLTRANRGWMMVMEGQEPIEFIELPSSGDIELHALSIEFDTIAGGSSMLSVDQDGAAILSTHGNFPSLGVVTHHGTCMPKDG